MKPNEEEQEIKNETKPIDEDKSDAISDLFKEYQSQLEAEKKARESAEAKVIELTKVIRSMSVQRVVEDDPAPVAKKSLKDSINALF